MNKKFIILFSLLALVILNVICQKEASASPVNQVVFIINSSNYTVNGTVYQMDAEPYIENDRAYIPLRYLSNALGVEEKNIIWNAENKSVVINSTDAKLKITIDECSYYLDEREFKMDVSPVIKAGRVYLPARYIAGALGYSVAWDNQLKAVLIGPPGKLPVVSQPAKSPSDLPNQTVNSDVKEDRIVARAEIFFPYSGGDENNVYNAGVAANYINGTVIKPWQEFSYNKVVGERTTERGFITGVNILNEPDVGGGVCRTSTVLYQTATKAGFDVVERHPHAYPVHYAPPGTDATVSWGFEDLKFNNSSANPVTIYTKLDEEADGRRLWAEFRDQVTREKVDVVVLSKAPGSCLWENIEDFRLTALLKNGSSFISLDQLCNLLAVPCDMEEREGLLNANINLIDKTINLKEGNKKAYVNGSEFELSEAPFRTSSGSTCFWLPLRDWSRLTGTEVIWVERSQPLILLNLSGTSVAGRGELKPDWLLTGQVKPYGYRELKQDLNIMSKLYPQLKINSIGYSASSQDIPVITLGNGPTQVFISGAWHANEYITAEFLMRFLEEACINSNEPEWKLLLSKVSLYISPMINPDGCEIVAHSNDLSPLLAQVIKSISPPNFDISLWRANIQGVDLNSQFPVRWEVAQNNLKDNVLPDGNAGEKPLTAPESRAVYDFTLNHNFKAVFCYHSQGQVLYWRSLDGEETPIMSYLTETYAKESGYSLINSADLSGGYRDWFVTAFKKPGITIEVGSGVNPLPLEQFASIYDKNYNALYDCLQLLAS